MSTNATAFGAPVQDSPAADAATATATGVDAPVADKWVDPNDPALTSEVIEDSGENAYATLPPIPDGKYRAKLKHRDVNGPDGKPAQYRAYQASWGQYASAPVPYLATALDADVIDLQGKYDGYQLTDFFVKTLPGRNGASQVATVLRATGEATPKAASHVQWMQLLLKKLASEPEAGIETQWEWNCQACEEKAKAAGEKKPRGLQGMHKFPQVPGKPGLHDPQLKCDACGAYGQARARIVAYLPLQELKGVRG